ncbi:hypothetical protein EDB83DRAFT_2319169 [Lactarius deliciosus]|nr:hypothetical protein EDB83DRAFT_2319169 [Lactarius deliciosus]
MSFSDGMGNVVFEFKSSGPPMYRQRMDQKDTLRSICTNMMCAFQIFFQGHKSATLVDLRFVENLPHCSIDEYPAHELEFLAPVSQFHAKDIQSLLEQMSTFSAPSLPSLSLVPLSSVPVICEGTLSMKQIFLTLVFFMQTFGDEEVDLIDCSLKEILRLYNTPEPCDQILKVKDWPSQDTFRGGKFAEVYEEFEDCLPFPCLTHLNGRDNLATHFPDNVGSPSDLVVAV